MGKVIAIGSVCAVIGLLVVFQITTPSEIGPLGILLVFVLMYVAALGGLTFLILGINKVVVKISSSYLMNKKSSTMSMSKAYYFASVIALAPVMIIGMQSVGQVGVYELLLVMLFLAIACIYVARRT